MSPATTIPARWISIDEAVAISGISVAQLVTHLQLFRPDRKTGEVHIGARALDRFMRTRSAREAVAAFAVPNVHEKVSKRSRIAA